MMLKVLNSLNKNVDCIDAVTFMIEKHEHMFKLLLIGDDIILNEMMFSGDLNNVWVRLHSIKSDCFHYMKLCWQFKKDTSCLQMITDMIILQLRKDKLRFE